MFCEEICSKLKARVGRGECLEEDLTVAELNEVKLNWCKYEQSFILKEKHYKSLH